MSAGHPLYKLQATNGRVRSRGQQVVVKGSDKGIGIKLSDDDGHELSLNF